MMRNLKTLKSFKRMKKTLYRGMWAVLLASSLFACNNEGESMKESTENNASKNSPQRLEMPKSEEKKSEASPTKKDATDSPTNIAKEREEKEESAPISSPEKVYENPFLQAQQTPFSTFSVDVDNASYTQTRNFINNGGLPPAGLVRLEEFINYFDYNYPKAPANAPFSVYTELGECPWNKKTKLFHIGLKGKEMNTQTYKPSNLVFLIDVSGSMDQPNKLPLLKKSFRYLLDNLREEDRVSIVVYAGAAGLVLPPTSDKRAIISALNNLKAGGSTAGGEGLRLAYSVAEKSLLPNGNNRIILASDGDFNVGESSIEAMEQLVAEKREKNIFMTVLGFGSGNYQDNRMETIANKGNGNYYYIDNDNESRKVFGSGLTGTLFTIAKDVKIQLEFNPAVVKSYRLLGYENRMLAKEDFENDKKDAGEIGAGHTVTALYEVELVTDSPTQKLLTLNLRYKEPKGTTSRLLAYDITKQPTAFAQCTEDFRFSSAVVAFGMVLRNSQYKGSATYTEIVNIAQNAVGKDKYGYRQEFIDLVKQAGKLQ
jgi:Ca-activated chloride channel family protein